MSSSLSMTFPAPSPWPGLRSLAGLGLFLAVCAGVFTLNGMITSLSVDGWYQLLIKPAGTPPEAAFPIVWGVLFLLMALGGWRAWRRCPPGLGSTALIRFGAQLGLTVAWTVLFFGFQAPFWALVELPLLLGGVGLTIATFSRIDSWAGIALVPCFLWVSYAVYLNAGICLLN